MKRANTLEQSIIDCTGCSRLLAHCKKVALEKKKKYSEWTYWGRPVPNFGSLDAQLIVVGLAPAAHGANRTGRMFTGDMSGVWLFRALHRAGFANQARSEEKGDGLELNNCLITVVCHCAPPDNKPTPKEIHTCEAFLKQTLELARRKKVILALGQIAWDAIWKEFVTQEKSPLKKIHFSHMQEVRLESGIVLLSSFHPSQQNTFTGRLSEQAFDEVFKRCRSLVDT
ncbi:uracil-DNA glycosylase [bacterium]|nr:uracil-DNA glycosylase [bacterium]